MIYTEIYIRGLYDEKNDISSYGCIIIEQGEEIHRSYRAVYHPGFISSKKLFGEIMGVIDAVKLSIKEGATDLIIHYSANGLKEWATGEWKANKNITQMYREYMKEAIPQLNSISFSCSTKKKPLPDIRVAESLAIMAISEYIQNQSN